MIKLFLFIKEKLIFLWVFIDSMNAALFKVFYKKKLNRLISKNLTLFRLHPYQFRQLIETDLDALMVMVNNQERDQLVYFEPHAFDKKSLFTIYKNHSFFMLGVFLNRQLVGYFFLRCFVNKKCFVGRLVDQEYRGVGIGKVMNAILYHTAWDAEFHCYATISKKNEYIMRAHANNPYFNIRKELEDDYLLVEFSESQS